jgi:cysteine desulfurase
MAANGEIGTLQPVADVGRLARRRGVPFHVDAVNAAGRVPVSVDDSAIDLLTLSSNDLYGPPGAGALWVRPEVKLAPIILGGGQERGYRAGTENVVAIAGFGAAAEAAHAAREADASRMAALRDRLEDGIGAATPQAVLFSATAPRLPNTSLVALPGIKAETALIAFDLNGIALSSGSACSSGKVQVSHVLEAMGVEPALASSALRISLGWETGESDIERLLTAWNTVVSSLLKKQPNIAA